jgi:hypothetical protein
LTPSKTRRCNFIDVVLTAAGSGENRGSEWAGRMRYD